VPIILKNSGFEKLRELPVMHRAIARCGGAAVVWLGPNYEFTRAPSQRRARGTVHAANPEGGFESADNPAKLIGSLRAAANAF